ncbi:MULTISPECIES: hypothetical protein [Thermaerobacter]|uniref:Holin n=1 Tax=Thermaerobacter composti TaxID=554949 RepID=A0ABZ0QRG5_9FIRM|nr:MULTISPECIES: hypothetical protein [Thermaerobacter]PZN03231.1 MAG: hypothetical protein DIU76_09650 [Bacillota bacterium]QBS37913.1 hypothetical protein E1B22_09190 [Thermaerobacter sp. FW80]WPD20081.1 hypothetical protein Q5761_05455 [Thermaerobacter composti]
MERVDPDTTGIVVAVPLIAGLVELLKRQGMPTRWAPPVALLLGTALAIGYALAGQSLWFEALIQGLALGLGSMGLYSGVKYYRRPEG